MRRRVVVAFVTTTIAVLAVPGTSVAASVAPAHGVTK
jgi:hypothetical protein